MNDFSYIKSAVSAISGYNNQYGLIGQYVERIQSENPSWALLNCVAVAHTRTIAQATEHKFRDGDAPVAQPIAFLDFVQTVMNKVSGLARQDMQGKRRDDFGNGIDFTQELTDELGFSVDSNKVVDLVNDDFFALNNLHCFIAQQMDYLTDIAPLHYFAESVKQADGTWIKDHIAESFDEAVSKLDAKAEAYVESLNAEKESDTVAIDFTAKATRKTKAKAKKVA